MRRKDQQSRFCNISKRDPGTKKIHTVIEPYSKEGAYFFRTQRIEYQSKRRKKCVIQ